MTNRERVDQIYEAVRCVNDVYEEWASAHGLTLYEMQIYYVIIGRQQMSITQKRLCEELDAPKTSINSIIKKQLQAGYIELRVNQQNKREKIVSLTESGASYARELIMPLMEMEEAAVAQFEDAAVENVIHTQGVFAGKLKKLIGEKLAEK